MGPYTLKGLQVGIDEALEHAKELKAEYADNPDQARRLALAITRLEEAELWLTKMW
jgi:hypothetical protein